MSDVQKAIQAAIQQDIQRLEPLPRVALGILDLAARNDVVPRDLIAVIETDAAITAKVLRLSNSPYFGFRREIASLREAGNLLGVSTLVSLVLTSCAGRYFRARSPGETRRLEGLWSRSVGNALGARLFARLADGPDAERAYTAGLLQDLGARVVEPHAETHALALRAELEQGATLVHAERAVLGLDHAEVGARLCARWNFPESLVDVVRHHHEPERAELDMPLAWCVHLGADLHARLDADLDDPRGTPDARALRSAGLDPGRVVGLEEVLAREIARAREFVEVGPEAA